MNKNTDFFETDYVVFPGEILEEYLDVHGMTQKELSDRINLSKKHVNEIIRGKASLQPATAIKLEKVFRRPAHFWNNLELLFQQDKARTEEKKRLKVHLDWLDKIPTKEMIKKRWIEKYKDKTQQLDEVLRFFGVSSPEQWEFVWKNYQVAYRQTERYEKCSHSLSAWLRQGEIEAMAIKCDSFNKTKFTKVLYQIRRLTLEPPDVFVTRLQEMCAETGVAVVFVPELKGTGIYGATRWIGDKAIIQLSLRYKSNDHLWFTFFHEAGHIISHGRKEIFLESKKVDGEKEIEADNFSKNHLIPLMQYNEFLQNWDKTLNEVKVFAEKSGIAPGIVVGRLQHDSQLAFNKGNNLKKFYEWQI